MRRLLLTFALAFLVPAEARGQRELQLWGNLTLDWVKSGRLTCEVDVEPKTLVVVPEGAPGWWNFDVTPSAAFAAKNWLDVTMELATGYTQQTDEIASVELTPRLGVTFHLLSRGVPVLVRGKERPAKRRVVLYNDLRVEWRNFFYTGDQPDSSAVRFRNRLGGQYALNREKVSDDGARYVTGDWEWFIPLSDPAERFVSRQRVRLGIGYRQSFHWRFEALYIWARTRSATTEGFKPLSNAIDIRVKHFF